MDCRNNLEIFEKSFTDWKICTVPLQSFRDGLCPECRCKRTFVEWKRHWNQTLKYLQHYKVNNVVVANEVNNVIMENEVDNVVCKDLPKLSERCEYDSPTFWHDILYSLLGMRDQNVEEIRHIFFLANQYIPISELSTTGDKIHLPIHELIVQGHFLPMYLSLIYELGYAQGQKQLQQNEEKEELENIKTLKIGMLFAVYDRDGSNGPCYRLVRIVNQDNGWFTTHWLGWDYQYDRRLLQEDNIKYLGEKDCSFLEVFRPQYLNCSVASEKYIINENMGKTIYNTTYNLFCSKISDILAKFPIVLISILFHYCSVDCFAGRFMEE